MEAIRKLRSGYLQLDAGVTAVPGGLVEEIL
jgi:hypothetical protein